MADPVEGPADAPIPGPSTKKAPPKPQPSAKDKGKGRAMEKDEMKGLQNVGDLKTLGEGMEGMGEQVWKGKGLTDSIKAVEVSFGSSSSLSRKLTGLCCRTNGIYYPPSSPSRD